MTSPPRESPRRLATVVPAKGPGQAQQWAGDRAIADMQRLRPFERRRFVPAAVALAAFSGMAQMDTARFRADVDRFVSQDPTVRVRS